VANQRGLLHDRASSGAPHIGGRTVDCRLQERLPAQRLRWHKRLRLGLLFGLDRALRDRGFAENAFAPFAAGAEFDKALSFFDLNFFLPVGLWITVVVVTARLSGCLDG